MRASILTFRCSSMVERLPVKETVVGSNPTTGATKNEKLFHNFSSRGQVMNLLDSFYAAPSIEKSEPILRKVIIYNFSCQPAAGRRFAATRRSSRVRVQFPPSSPS